MDRCAVAGILLCFCLAAPPEPAAAATPLVQLTGLWSGGGSDRDGPFASAQNTRCRARLASDATHLSASIDCSGDAGLRKHIRFSVAFEGDRFTGSVEQVSRTGEGAPTRYAGSVTGSRNGDVANFTANFGAFLPRAHVALTLVSPTTYSMRISVLGSTLTDVTLRKGQREFR